MLENYVVEQAHVVGVNGTQDTRGEVSVSDAARQYQACGYSIIPEKDGKKPAIKGWPEYASEPADEGQIRQWVEQGLFENVGLLTGTRHGDNCLVALDFDNVDDFKAVAKKYPEDVSRILINKTARGCHLVFLLPVAETPDKPAGKWLCCGKPVELKAAKGKITVPPSIHPTGHSYEWCRMAADGQLELIDELPCIDDLHVIPSLRALDIVRGDLPARQQSQDTFRASGDVSDDYVAKNSLLVQEVLSKLEARGKSQRTERSIICRCPCRGHKNGDQNLAASLSL